MYLSVHWGAGTLGVGVSDGFELPYMKYWKLNPYPLYKQCLHNKIKIALNH